MDRFFIIKDMIMIIILSHKRDVMDGKCINRVCSYIKGRINYVGGKMLGGCRFVSSSNKAND